MIGTALEALGVGLIGLGVLVMAITVYGVVRMKGLFNRLQAASKAAMLGAVAILSASIGTGDGTMIARALIVSLFLLLTTPIAAHVIGQSAYRRDRAGSGSPAGPAGEDPGRGGEQGGAKPDSGPDPTP